MENFQGTRLLAAEWIRPTLSLMNHSMMYDYHVDTLITLRESRKYHVVIHTLFSKILNVRNNIKRKRRISCVPTHIFSY